MKIKTKLTISIILTIIMALAAGTVVVSTSQHIIESHEDLYFAEQILNGIFELNLVTYDYVTYHEERAIIQWNLKYDSISELLVEKNVENDEKRVILEKIRRNHENVKSIFYKIVELHKNNDIDKDTFIDSGELELRLTSQLFVISYDMVSSATELVYLSSSQEIAVEQRAKWILIPLMLIMIGVISTTLFLFNRTVVNPITKLHEGTEIISKGNLDYRLNYDSDDEIGKFSMAFDRMLDKLNVITSSRDELNLEIEARKKSEEEIKISERKYKDLFIEAQRFRYALDRVPSYVYIKDLQSRYNYGNQLTLELFNRSAEELVGCDDSQFFSPDTVKRLREIDSRVFNGETTNEEIENIDENGVSHHYLEVKSPIFAEQNSKKIVGLIGISTDITERKQDEENLRASEKKYSTLVEKGNDGILIIQDTILKFANEIMYEMTGFVKEEVIGKPFLDFVVPEFRQIVSERYEKRMKGYKIPNKYEIEIISKGGENISIEINATQIEYEGKPADMAMIRDMTHRKKLEKLVIENQSLALANKTKSEFLSVMSHELRTPLNASIGFSELLKMGKAGELNEKQGKFVDNILNSSKHLLDLIEGILDFSKIESGKMELNIGQILLYEFIDNTLNLMKATASEHNVILKSEIDPELNFIECDARMLKQILFNLLDNAVKFSKDEGGSVTVTAVKDGEMVIISVFDTGIGIKDVNGDKLFSFFKQLDNGYTRKYKGTGLGLAITKQLVELQGGRIWVESKYGEGSTFTVILPIVHSTPESSEAQK